LFSTSGTPEQDRRKLFKPVLAVHAGAFVYVGFGDVGAASGGYAVFDAFADEAAHEERAAFYPAVGLWVPGDLRVSHRVIPLSTGCRVPILA
jgi:hypothetical protein